MPELLVVYQRILDTISDLPPVPMVLWKHGGRLHYLPRPRWLLRYFVVRHIDRMLASLTRRYSARTALGWATEAEQQDREAVREFQQSLSPTRQNTYYVLLVVAIVVLYRPIINMVVPRAINLTEAATGPSELRQQVLDTVEKVAAALTANVTSVNQALNALLSGGVLHLGIVTLGVVLSLYVVLRPFVPAFRLKRMLFNLAPESEDRYHSAVARWSASQATGLYESERRVFQELGGQPPREFPFDLVVSALVMVLPLAFSSGWFRLGVIGPSLKDRVAFLSLGACALIPALVRLGWLYQTWQRRQLGHSGPYMPFEVGIGRGRAVAKVERPIGIRMLFFLLVFVLVAGTDVGGSEAPTLDILVILDILGFALLTALALSLVTSLPWWYRINRELRDLNHAYDTPTSGRRPVPLYLKMLASVLILLLSSFFTITIGGYDLNLVTVTATIGGLLLISSFVRTCQRIRRAQGGAGQRESLWSAWMLTPGLVLPPFLVAYLQHELNKVWAVEGEPLDPWPVDTSRKVEYSIGTMPWLKGLTATPRDRRP